MAIKHTKDALKSERDALQRYRRYLPTLQLKKQQLFLELQRVEVLLLQKKEGEEALWQEVRPWLKLFSETVPWENYLQMERVVTARHAVAGVEYPILQEIILRRTWPDGWQTPLWVDDGLRFLEKLIRLRVEQGILHQQADSLRAEWRITNQRVNLFEKVKIPDCLQNIRAISVFLGEVQAAEVIRAKLAKSKVVKQEGGGF